MRRVMIYARVVLATGAALVMEAARPYPVTDEWTDAVDRMDAVLARLGIR